jgi:hypothetical protein
VHEATGVAGQPGQDPGPVGVMRGADVAGQRAEPDDDGGERRDQHDETEFEPDRPVPEVADQPAHD